MAARPKDVDQAGRASPTPPDRQSRIGAPPPDEKIGHGKLGFKLPIPQLVRIAMMITCLVAIIVLRDACGQGVAGFFNAFAPPPGAADAGHTVPRP